MTGRWLWVMLVGAVLCCGGAARGEQLPRAAAEDYLRQASAAYEAGIAKLATDRAGAQSQFKQAAAMYRLLVESGVGASGSMYLNLGNAYLLAGDRGRGVLAYRRAERLMPLDADLKAALDAAREKLGKESPAPPTAPAWYGVVEVARVLPERMRWLLFVLTFGGAWVLALVRLFGARGDGAIWRVARWVMVVCAVGGAVTMAGVIGPEVADRMYRRGVVVAASAETRTGPSEAVHGPGSPATLPGGTEFVLVERAGSGESAWSKVRIGTGTEVWVRSGDGEMVAGP